jgi:hypothetical protein
VEESFWKRLWTCRLTDYYNDDLSLGGGEVKKTGKTSDWIQEKQGILYG